jgi:hypothetical protein
MTSFNAAKRLVFFLRMGISFALLTATGYASDNSEAVPRVLRLGLATFQQPMLTYYSEGAKARGEKIAADIAAMNMFFEKHLGIQPAVRLAVLNSNDWQRAESRWPYGMPHVDGAEPVVFMPAHGGMIFDGIMAGRKDIPVDQLTTFLKRHNTTFEAIAEKQVEWIGFHELGHVLTKTYGIDPRCRWLSEFLATYFGIAFTEQAADWKDIQEFPVSLRAKRPRNTTLADFERLYDKVDDYTWYQTVFVIRAAEVHSTMGLAFLTSVKQDFPAKSGSSVPDTPLSPEEVLSRLERIAPGFQKWAEVFQESNSSAK